MGPLKTGPEPSRDGPVIIQVTGSRRWSDHAAVRTALYDAIEVCTPVGASPRDCPASDMLLRHGGAKGLDTIAGREAAAIGMRVRKYPADWTAPCDETCTHGARIERYDRTTYCPASGLRRNQAMIDLQPPASVVLAFLIGGAEGSRGSFDCAIRAQRAGLPVYWYEPPSRITSIV